LEEKFVENKTMFFQTLSRPLWWFLDLQLGNPVLISFSKDNNILPTEIFFQRFFDKFLIEGCQTEEEKKYSKNNFAYGAESFF